MNAYPPIAVAGILLVAGWLARPTDPVSAHPGPALAALSAGAPAPPTPAPRAEPPAEDNFPPAAVGERDLGPDIATIDLIANHYGPVVFDHLLHVEMCELTADCASCHHETEPGAEITACRECHPTSRGGGTLEQPSLKGAYHRQCLGCHRDWSHANACGFCHQDASGSDPVQFAPVFDDPTDLFGSPHAHLLSQQSYDYHTELEGVPVVTFHHEDHVTTFGLECADCHRDATCGQCHGPEATPFVVDRQENCYSCHSSSNCVTCHSPAGRPRFEHGAATGWSLGRNHADLSCIQCHGADRDFTAPPSDRCLACHVSGEAGSFVHADGAVPLGGSHDSYACTWCHPGDGADLGVRCDGCHSDRSYPLWLPGLGGSRLLGASTGQ